MSGWRDVGLLVVASLIGQLGGNVLFQWSLGVVGLALAVPLTLGSLIVNGALLGHYVLRDRMTTSMMVAGTVLVFAIVVLSIGADSAHLAVASSESFAETAPWYTLAGVVAACVSGFAYSCLGLAIRYTGRHGMPMPSTLMVASLAGTLALGVLTYGLHGLEPVVQTPSGDWLAMVGAGVFNAVAFLAFTKALHTGSLFFVNAVNTTQITMAAVLGIVIFHEPPTVSLVVGLALTMAGLLLMGRRPKPPA
jgi:drug/metabolite transporter (DMT)-like permease